MLVSRSGHIQDVAIKTTFALPQALNHRVPATGYGPNGEALPPEGVFVQCGLVDSAGRVIYTQRW